MNNIEPWNCEGVSARELAERFGTPTYIYSLQTLKARWFAYKNALNALPHLICYAVKANSNLALLTVLAKLGAGFDVVSGGELQRVLRAGGQAQHSVFSGVGKQPWEMQLALSAGIHSFNVESAAELRQLEQVAQSMRLIAPISLRVNPDVDAQTHPYIATGLKENKFGIPMEDALPLYLEAARSPHLRIRGIDCHIGSQLLSLSPFTEALEKILGLIDQLAAAGISLGHLNIGGGLGVAYRPEEIAPSPEEYIAQLQPLLQHRSLTLLCEPGRSLIADAGTLLTRVILLKPGQHKNFAVVDAAMNDLLRPTLYGAWMNIQEAEPSSPTTLAESKVWDIVGPVCETGDFLGKDRQLNLHPDSLLVVTQAGAYGMSMSSNYNTRCRSAEVLVDRGQCHLIRRRESLDDLLATESALPESFHVA